MTKKSNSMWRFFSFPSTDTFCQFVLDFSVISTLPDERNICIFEKVHQGVGLRSNEIQLFQISISNSQKPRGTHNCREK